MMKFPRWEYLFIREPSQDGSFYKLANENFTLIYNQDDLTSLSSNERLIISCFISKMKSGFNFSSFAL